MILIEASLSVWLFGSMRLKQAAIASCGLHLAFLFDKLALIRGPDIENCGCFGVFWARPLTMNILVEDGIMIAFSLTMVALAARVKDQKRFEMIRKSFRRTMFTALGGASVCEIAQRQAVASRRI